MHYTPLQNSISFFLPHYYYYYFSLQYYTFLLLLSSSSNINLSFLSCFQFSIYSLSLWRKRPPYLLTYLLSKTQSLQSQGETRFNSWVSVAINGNQKEITLQRFEASMGDFLDGLLYTNQDYCYYGPTELLLSYRSISFLSTEFLWFPSPLLFLNSLGLVC